MGIRPRPRPHHVVSTSATPVTRTQTASTGTGDRCMTPAASRKAAKPPPTSSRLTTQGVIERPLVGGGAGADHGTVAWGVVGGPDTGGSDDGAAGVAGED